MLSKRRVLSIGIALLVLFVSLQLFFQSRYLSDKAKKTVASRLEAALGHQVEIGRVSLRIIPTALIVKNLSIKSGAPERPVTLQADKVRIAFSPASFFTETFFIREVQIEAPELRIAAPRAGDPPLIRNAEKENGPARPPAIVVRSIAIKDGSLNFKGEAPFQEVSFSDLDFTIRPNLEMTRFEIDLDGKGGAYAIEEMKGEIEGLDGELIIQGDEILLKKGKLTTAQAALLADGTIMLGKTPRMDLGIDLRHRLEALDLEGLAGEQAPFLKENRLSGGIAFLGRISGSYPDLRVRGEAVFTELALNGEAVGSLQSNLDFEAGRVSLKGFQGKVFSGEISGDLQADLARGIARDDATAAQTEQTQAPKAPQVTAALRYADLPLYPIETLLKKIEPGQDGHTRGLFASGDLHLEGDIEAADYRAEGRVSLVRDPLFSPPLPDNADPLHRLLALFQSGGAAWRWSEAGLSIEEGAGAFPNTRLAFTAHWNADEGLRAETQVESKEVAPIAKAFHVPLNGSAKIEGQWSHAEDGTAFRGNLSLEEAELNRVPFKELSAAIKVEDKRVAFTHGILKGPGGLVEDGLPAPPSDYSFLGDLDLTETASPGFDFKVKVISGNPQEVFRFFHLSIPFYTVASGHLGITGKGADFLVKGPLSASEGRLYGEAFESGRVDLEVTPEEVRLSNAYLVRGDSRIEGNGAIAYDHTYWLALKGKTLRIQETAFLKDRLPGLSGDVVLKVSGKGSFDAPAILFEGKVSRLRYGAQEDLHGEITADWKNGAVQFESRFPHPEVALTGEVRLEPGYPFSFQGRFRELQLDPFFKEQLKGAAAEVAVSATGELEGSGKLTELAQINLAGTLSDLSAGFNAYRLQNDGPLAVAAREGVFTFDQTRLKGDNTALIFNGSLRLLKEWDLFVTGEADLNLITFFTKEVTDANGKALLDLTISDRWRSPRIFGQLKLKDGRIRTATLAQNIHIATLTALFNERQLVLEAFEGKLGDGRFLVTGKAELAGFAIDAFGLLIQLEDARVNLAKDLPATVDGELLFKKEDKSQTLKGDLKIKKLVYQKKVDLPSIIRDYQKKEKTAAPAEMPLIGRTELNIHLSGENGVQIDNNIAQVPLGVDLLIKGSFDRPTMIGRIDASTGKIVFRDNTFRLTSGSVDFLNPNKIDPTFDLAAKTEVRNDVTKRNYKIDLLMSGNLSHVNLGLSSFPSLPEDDILALLAIGKTSADLRNIKGGAGAEAGSFAVEQLLTGSVSQLTGIVEKPVEELTGTTLRVDPYLNGSNARTSTGTRLTAEKQLMKDRLLVVYSTTLDPSEEDLIRMVYEINKNISLVGNRDDTGQIGGDIRFRFEFR